MARRFIAGAVCPKCEQMDKIYIEDNQEPSAGGMASVATCAACGYELEQPDDNGDVDIKEQPVDEAVTFVNFKK